jgi:nucleotide-binding universal stress UspA family protein
MFRLKKILFPTDFSDCADQAMEQAIYLSRRFKAELHMLHVSVLHTMVDYAGYLNDVNSKLKNLARDHMAAAIEAHKAGDLKIKQIQSTGMSAGSIILEYTGAQDIDLIVMGTHGRRGLGHLFLGSIAEETVRLAPCPVLTIRESKEQRPLDKIERILVPIDFSEHSRKALAYAGELAAIYGARLQLLHVIEEPIYPAFYSAYYIFPAAALPNVETETENELRQLIRVELKPEVVSEIHVVHGRAAQNIADFARYNQSDLVVIATHGLTGFKHLLIGSVAEKVVRLAPCPVFTLKAFGKSLIEG